MDSESDEIKLLFLIMLFYVPFLDLCTNLYVKLDSMC